MPKPTKEMFSMAFQAATFLAVCIGIGVIKFTPAVNARLLEEQARINEGQAGINSDVLISITRLASSQAGTDEDIDDIKADLDEIERRTRNLEIRIGRD